MFSVPQWSHRYGFNCDTVAITLSLTWRQLATPAPPIAILARLIQIGPHRRQN
jgi:hypothetical protein